MNFEIEKLTSEYAKEVADILNFYIKTTTSVYRSEAVEEDFVQNFIEGPNIYCSFVIKNHINKIIGFCTLEPYSEITTFSLTAEVMYFINHEYTGKGAGSFALRKLEEEAKKIGVKKLLADISTENDESIHFHKLNGFIECGRLPDIGEKFGRKFGVVTLLKDL